MTPKKTVTLYADHARGSIKAHVVGGFMRGSRHLLLISPGYDSQGRRRTGWTQVVYGDTPIWEFKRQANSNEVCRQFAKLWDEAFGQRNTPLIEKALQMVVAARNKAWKDGESGMAPAPAITKDGRSAGQIYTA